MKHLNNLSKLLKYSKIANNPLQYLKDLAKQNIRIFQKFKNMWLQNTSFHTLSISRKYSNKKNSKKMMTKPSPEMCPQNHLISFPKFKGEKKKREKKIYDSITNKASKITPKNSPLIKKYIVPNQSKKKKKKKKKKKDRILKNSKFPKTDGIKIKKKN